VPLPPPPDTDTDTETDDTDTDTGDGDAAGAAPTIENIRTRDQLIVDQENLLNAYRCFFDIDTQVVPGGCTNGQPAQPPTQPLQFDSTPTPQDIRTRDQLIADQENLLNAYRCMFSIDTQQVPYGCTNGQPNPPPAAAAQITLTPHR